MNYLELIYNVLGGTSNIVTILGFVASLFIVASCIKNKLLRLGFSILFSAFIVVEISSLFFTQSFVGYQYYVHFNLRGVDSIVGLYIPHLIFAVALWIGLTWSSFKVAVVFKLFKIELNTFPLRVLAAVFGVIIFLCSLTSGDFMMDSKTLYTALYSKNENFQEVVLKTGLTDYVSADQVKSSAGKNVIIISLESFEKAFLAPPYDHLSPNLQALKNKWNYYSLETNTGSTWTSASLYTFLTGFPSFFGMEGNSIFQSAFHSKINSISNTYKKAGYENIFMNGNADNSGIKEMLQALSFDEIVDCKSINTGNESVYGIRDMDLFDLAKNKVLESSTKGKPFTLVISTTDTHAPDGIYDVRMEKHVKKQESDYLFMVSAVDFMVGDFIHFIEQKGLLENTVIFIFPDHLKMGDPSMFKNSDERGLYLLTNADIPSLSKKTDTTLYQVDLPQIILEGSGVNHNGKYLSHYIKGDKNEFIKQHSNEITAINTSGFSRFNSNKMNLKKVSKLYPKYKVDRTRFIAHAGGEINGYTYTNSLDALDSSYKKGFRMFELDIQSTSDSVFVAAHDWEHWKSNTQWKGETPPSLKEFKSQLIYQLFTPLDINAINNWFAAHPDAILVTDKVNDPQSFSRAFKFPDRLMMELFTMESVQMGLKCNILSVMPTHELVAEMSKVELSNLVSSGVKNIAISYSLVLNNPSFIQNCKTVGLDPYVFHMNVAAGIGEEYFAKHYMDSIYGVYADNWEF